MSQISMTAREHQLQFNETLAMAITQWQAVEIELFRIFAGLVKATDSERYLAVSAAFHAVINFNTRLSMTHAAASIALDEDGFNIWRGLHKRLDKRSKKRNALVHFMVIYDATKPGVPPHLQPSIFNVTEGGLHPRFKYGLRHIEAFRQSFGRLAHDAHCFANELWKRASAPPIHPQPETHPDLAPDTPGDHTGAES